MSIKRRLAKDVWESEAYLKASREGSLDVKHPGMLLLDGLNRKYKKILDLGCGEGTRLSEITKNGTGIDISRTAILKAKKSYPNLKFVVGNLEKLPFGDSSFDLVYSAYVFEHLRNPEKVIREARRVLKPKGCLVIMCPNYGAPNRSSPPFEESRVKKLVFGFLNDLTLLFRKVNELDWNKVIPIADVDSYESDQDVTIEPYSLTLEKYLKVGGFKIMKNISTWEYEFEGVKFIQKIFRFFGTLGLYPFCYWSPHIVVQAEKI